MKIGVDGVLIGCWTNIEGAKSILDVGCGCGLIAFILAQRCQEARIVGIDIDKESIEEANENMHNSPWSDRIGFLHGDFPSDIDERYNSNIDLIVSNPPYFNSGVKETLTSRERARHQGGLSPTSLLKSSVSLLSSNGSVALIVPSEISISLEEEARTLGFSLKRKCLVRGHDEAPYKRTLLQWQLQKGEIHDASKEIEYLTLEISRGIPSEEYRNLCKDFYLKF
ncbi:MAG: methyltransferase domain-containing protein [Muribaculaceae bacterium]|nr:methyltransferase domain-containing protein [Muribaculaceae bacterium]